MQVSKCREQYVHSMPGPKRADEADEKPAVKVKTRPHRPAVQTRVEQTRINGVRQNVDHLRLHSGFYHPAFERLGNGDQQIRLLPNPALDPACQWWAGQACTVPLLLIS